MARRVSPLSDAVSRAQSVKQASKTATVASAERAVVKPAKQPGRAGLVFFGCYITPLAKKQLKLLLVELDQTEQAAAEEALDDFFAKHGRHRIASRS